MWYYFLVFIAAFIVDLVPFVGPPAWTVMVFLQMYFSLSIWLVLIVGVVGSTCGRYVLSRYISRVSSRLIKAQKNEDIQFIGQKLAGDGWEIQLFVLLYTLMPLPSTPLFTAAGMAKVRPMHILPSFFIGKFTSDMIMVFTGDYVASNAQNLTQVFLSWKSISGTLLGVVIICIFLFIDWRKLLQERKFSLNFDIWK